MVPPAGPMRRFASAWRPAAGPLVQASANPMIGGMKAMLLRGIAPVDSSPWNCRSADSRAGTRRGADPRALLRRLPHRSARDRGRSAATEIADHSRPPDRRHGRLREATGRRPTPRHSASGSAWPGCGIPAVIAASARRDGKTSASRPASPAITPTAAMPSMPSPRPISSTRCPTRSATSRRRRCCVRASSAIGRCGGAICGRAERWPCTASARRPTW